MIHVEATELELVALHKHRGDLEGGHGWLDAEQGARDDLSFLDLV